MVAGGESLSLETPLLMGRWSAGLRSVSEHFSYTLCPKRCEISEMIFRKLLRSIVEMRVGTWGDADRDRKVLSNGNIILVALSYSSLAFVFALGIAPRSNGTSALKPIFDCILIMRGHACKHFCRNGKNPLITWLAVCLQWNQLPFREERGLIPQYSEILGV